MQKQFWKNSNRVYIHEPLSILKVSTKTHVKPHSFAPRTVPTAGICLTGTFFRPSQSAESTCAKKAVLGFWRHQCASLFGASFIHIHPMHPVLLFTQLVTLLTALLFADQSISCRCSSSNTLGTEDSWLSQRLDK